RSLQAVHNDLAEFLGPRMLRIYLTGRLSIELDRMVVDERRLPGRQARLAFAFLCCRRGPVSREELGDVIWPEELPTEWDTALTALISRPRGVPAGLEQPGPPFIGSAFGCYELYLPSDAWVDVAAAAEAADEAEGALRAGEPGRAWGPAQIAAITAR